MNLSTTDSNTRFNETSNNQIGAVLLSAGTITGDEVCNMQEEKLGKIQDLVLDIGEGKVRYAVLASGGFLGMGDRLFAIPWSALKLDKENRRFKLDINAERLKDAPGFDKDNWPDMTDSTWHSSIESYYVR
ncbi:MAG: PRC-barrel domain-containing protein [Saccharospirillum sp.]|nr:PRC-barrel domain-containing protein [Saccharospirillum sp.]